MDTVTKHPFNFLYLPSPKYWPLLLKGVFILLASTIQVQHSLRVLFWQRKKTFLHRSTMVFTLFILVYLKVYIHIIIGIKSNISGTIIINILCTSNIVNIPYCVFIKVGLSDLKLFLIP